MRGIWCSGPESYGASPLASPRKGVFGNKDGEPVVFESCLRVNETVLLSSATEKLGRPQRTTGRNAPQAATAQSLRPATTPGYDFSAAASSWVR